MLKPSPGYRQPALNVPRIITIILMILIAVHVIRSLFPGNQADLAILLRFSFIPFRYFNMDVALPGELGAMLWSPVTYSLLHADFSHLVINGLWLLVFGSAVARRFGTRRFLILSAAAAGGGALVHLLSYPNDIVPLVGASAAISGHMAAAIRFVFEPGGPMGQNRSANAWYRPAPPLRDLFRNRMALAFTGIWFAINLLAGVGTFDMDSSGGVIAWQAHVGGFLIGLFLFPVLDPVGSGPQGPVAKPARDLAQFRVVERDKSDRDA